MVEQEAIELARSHDLLSTPGCMSVFSIFLELRLRGVIDSNILAAIDELRRLRNRAVHEPEPDISTEDAIEYITSAERVA